MSLDASVLVSLVSPGSKVAESLVKPHTYRKRELEIFGKQHSVCFLLLQIYADLIIVTISQCFLAFFNSQLYN
jgi:hypothetical protein